MFHDGTESLPAEADPLEALRSAFADVDETAAERQRMDGAAPDEAGRWMSAETDFLPAPIETIGSAMPPRPSIAIIMTVDVAVHAHRTPGQFGAFRRRMHITVRSHAGWRITGGVRPRTSVPAR